jgi:MFS family permease
MQAPQAAPHRWRDLSLLLASTMTIMAGATLAPALPGMRDAFSAEAQIEFWVKLLLAIPGLCIALCAPFFGRQINRLGRKPLLIGGLVIYGISGSIGYFFHESLVFLLITRLLLGIAVAAIMVAGMTLAGDYYQGPPLAKYMGLQAAFGGFGGVVFMASAGLLANLDWTAPFLIYLLALLLLPICIIFLAEPAQQAVKTPDNSVPAAIQNTADNATEKTNLMLAMCCSFAFVEMLLLYLIPLNFPFFIQQLAPGSNSIQWLNSPAAIGFAMASWLLLAALVSINYARIQQGKTHSLIQAAGLVLIAAGFGSLAIATHLSLVLLGLALSGIGFGLIRPNLVVWLFSFTPPPLRGMRIGSLTRWYFIGQITCALIVEPLVNLLGYDGCYLLFAGIALLLSVLLTTTRTRTDENSLDKNNATAQAKLD